METILSAPWTMIATSATLASVVGFLVLPAMTIWTSVVGLVASLASVTRSGRRRLAVSLLCLLISASSFSLGMLWTSHESLMTGSISVSRLNSSRELKLLGESLMSFRDECGHWPRDLKDLLESKHAGDIGILHGDEEGQRHGTQDEWHISFCKRYVYLGGMEKSLPIISGRELLVYTRPGMIDCPGLFSSRFWKVSWPYRRIRNDGFALLLFSGGEVDSCFHGEELLDEPPGEE